MTTTQEITEASREAYAQAGRALAFAVLTEGQKFPHDTYNRVSANIPHEWRPFFAEAYTRVFELADASRLTY